jgi:hypothetical protein
MLSGVRTLLGRPLGMTRIGCDVFPRTGSRGSSSAPWAASADAEDNGACPSRTTRRTRVLSTRSEASREEQGPPGARAAGKTSRRRVAARDGADFGIAGMWLDDAEFMELLRGLTRVLQPRVAYPPNPAASDES